VLLFLEQVRMYKISLYPILSFMFIGGIMFFSFCFMGLKEILSHKFLSIVESFFSFVFLGYFFYLLRKRREGKGFYWDEIEDIKYFKGRVGISKSTVIYPNYTNHEKIRIRRKKWMPTTSHSIDWFLI
jgi:hypothetical protein